MEFNKQHNLKILGVSILIVVLLIPGITLAQQVINSVYAKMVTPTALVAPETDEEPSEDLGDPIITETAAAIEQELNDNLIDQEKVAISEQQVYGNKLVYVDANTQEMKYLNLKTKQITKISDTPFEKSQLVIFKNRLVWVELNAIWLYDFEDGSIEQIVNQDRDFYQPDIYGDFLVYLGAKEEGIYLYNFKTRKTTTITFAPDVWHSHAKIWKNIITWIDDTDGYRNAYYYDLKKNKKVKITHITNKEKDLWNSHATKNSIVYVYVQDGYRRLDEYNLKTGELKEIPNLRRGKLNITVDKYDGESLSYVRADKTLMTLNLKTKEETEYGPMYNKAYYGGVVFGIEKADINAKSQKYKIHRK